MIKVLDQIRTELAGRLLQSGGWSSLARGLQTALQPTCLALLAFSFDAQRQTPDPLLLLERRDGSCDAFEAADRESGLTGLLLALHFDPGKFGWPWQPGNLQLGCSHRFRDPRTQTNRPQLASRQGSSPDPLWR